MPNGLSSRTHVWLVARLTLLLLLLTAEMLALFAHLYPLGPHIAPPLLFLAALLFYAGKGLNALSLPRPSVQWPPLLLHAVVFSGAAAFDAFLLHRARLPSTSTLLMGGACVLALLMYTLTAALLPATDLHAAKQPLLRALLPAVALACVLLAVRRFFNILWDAPNSRLGHALESATFASARWVLELFYPFVYSRPSDHVLGTRAFGVRITATCSGIESLGLILVVALAWTFLLRRELRARRVLCLVPLALAITFALNVLRIALLIALGNAGHPAFALQGFHSHAGWILFNAVAISFLFATRKLHWVQRSQCTASQPRLGVV